MGIEGTEQRAKEGRVGDGEDEERGQTLGGQPDYCGNGIHDMEMSKDERSKGE